MSLSSAAENVGYHAPSAKCAFGAILDALSPEDLAFYTQMIADNASSEGIMRVFRADGHTIGKDTVRRHRVGECSCP